MSEKLFVNFTFVVIPISDQQINILTFPNFTAKSPAFTHLSATLGGLSTVRAFNAEEILKREFDSLQDVHSACWHMVISTNCVFGLSLDIICVLFTTSIIFYFILFDTEVSGEKIGLAVTQALSLTGLVQFG